MANGTLVDWGADPGRSWGGVAGACAVLCAGAVMPCLRLFVSPEAKNLADDEEAGKGSLKSVELWV